MFEKLCEVKKRARPGKVDEATRRMFEKNTKPCETFAIFRALLRCFRVSLPTPYIVFNREVALDLIWIEKKTLLYVFDIDIGFNSANFLSYKAVEAV